MRKGRSKKSYFGTTNIAKPCIHFLTAVPYNGIIACCLPIDFPTLNCFLAIVVSMVPSGILSGNLYSSSVLFFEALGAILEDLKRPFCNAKVVTCHIQVVYRVTLF